MKFVLWVCWLYSNKLSARLGIFCECALCKTHIPTILCPLTVLPLTKNHETLELTVLPMSLVSGDWCFVISILKLSIKEIFWGVSFEWLPWRYYLCLPDRLSSAVHLRPGRHPISVSLNLLNAFVESHLQYQLALSMETPLSWLGKVLTKR